MNELTEKLVSIYDETVSKESELYDSVRKAIIKAYESSITAKAFNFVIDRNNVAAEYTHTCRCLSGGGSMMWKSFQEVIDMSLIGYIFPNACKVFYNEADTVITGSKDINEAIIKAKKKLTNRGYEPSSILYSSYTLNNWLPDQVEGLAVYDIDIYEIWRSRIANETRLILVVDSKVLTHRIAYPAKIDGNTVYLDFSTDTIEPSRSTYIKIV